jgi:membrane-associated protein
VHQLTQYLNPDFLIRTFGLLGVFFIVFAESGLFFGFFLPGDSLLVTAGLFAAKGELNIAVLIVGCVIAAIAGDSVGFAFGHKTGQKLFKEGDPKIAKAKAFYDKHGGKTIILARFMPFIRTFAPIVAGAAKMHYPSFLSFNIIGGLIWAILMPVLGYTLGKSMSPEQLDKYFLIIIGVIIFVSVLPPAIEYVKHYLHSHRQS